MALNFNKKHKVVTKDEIYTAARTGAIAAVGPSFSSLPVVLSMIVLVGSSTTFMRCGVIGAAPFELMMADLASQTAGVQFGSPEFTESVFTLCIFGMVLGSAPYFINTIITLKPLDKMIEKSKESQKRSFVSYMSNAAMIGVLTNLLMDKFTALPPVVAALVSGVMTVGVVRFSKKSHNKILGSFSMAIGMICAMIIGQALTMIMG